MGVLLSASATLILLAGAPLPGGFTSIPVMDRMAPPPLSPFL